jgi:hypothetical protein
MLFVLLLVSWAICFPSRAINSVYELSIQLYFLFLVWYIVTVIFGQGAGDWSGFVTVMTQRSRLPCLQAPKIRANRFNDSDEHCNDAIISGASSSNSTSSISSSIGDVDGDETNSKLPTTGGQGGKPCMRLSVAWLSPAASPQLIDVDLEYVLEMKSASAEEWTVAYCGSQLSFEIPQVYVIDSFEF